ncbi:hypothetical protein SERLA73DRAFT_179133 [Serpula lacrymans var. lacrymans S7.3]|uniref:DUF6534 domain-containing protein n=2 Tax=Serpula lacrymans var. lacrymans TaxID=341189 RepID=F8PTT5_SERL3|nr:uncharacterized protein SERLADRAFT_447867 [Serpula lacrymans var. lacrymans S7.9]EGO01080.1 hypothetical protein SERLA73DRAFT_179133 [Serpula lacrymans var. lacrymans S7.3]EGO26738.1 hypothetical protein SERLADRAFT_447867 [Serpula lacrymans var. lacrymans S7.9]
MDVSSLAVLCITNATKFFDAIQPMSGSINIKILLLNYSSPLYYFSGNVPRNADILIGFGYVLSFAFFGVLVVQTFIYQTRFPNDRMVMRYFIWAVLLLEALSCVFTLIAFGKGLSLACLACAVNPTQWPLYMGFSCILPPGIVGEGPPAWSFLVLSILTGLISSMVHGFFCWRLWVINKSLIVPCVVMMISLLQCIIVIYDATGNITAQKEYSANPQAISLGGDSAAWSDYLWLGSSFVCDIIITVQTTRLLFKLKSASGIKNTKSLLSKLIKLTFETGMVTSVATLVELIMAVTLPQYYHLLIFYSLSKLYANCMMATLNTRLVLHGDDKTDQVATALFVPPHIDRTATSSLHFRSEGQQCRSRTTTYNPSSEYELVPFPENEGIGFVYHENQSEDASTAFQASEVIIIKPPPILSQSSTED